MEFELSAQEGWKISVETSSNNTLKKVRTYLHVARAGGIVRRYFVVNASTEP